MDDGYFYIKFNVEGMAVSGANLSAVNKAVNKVNLDTKAIKCYLNKAGTSVTICIESFYSSANDVIKFFDIHTRILKAGRERLVDNYSEFDD